MLLKDKTALITGSSRGIGRAVALLFAKKGARIVVHYNNNEYQADETVALINKIGSEAIKIKCDLRLKDNVSSMVKKAISSFGGIDVLVNNAGIRKDSFMLNMTENDWREVIETNLSSTFLCSKFVGKHMVVRKKGTIVNISSLSGVSGRPAQANYASSKAGIIALTKSLALELARWNIRVNTVVPGMIETDMTKSLNPEVITSLKIPMGRMGTPDEVAQCAYFLASDMSSYITGASISVNGGVYT